MRTIPLHNDDTARLRSWRDVAAMYTARTGEPITSGGAHYIGEQAMQKLREQGLSDDVLRAFAGVDDE